MEDDDLAQVIVTQPFYILHATNVCTSRSEKPDSSSSKLKAEVEEAEEVAPAAGKTKLSTSPPLPLPSSNHLLICSQTTRRYLPLITFPPPSYNTSNINKRKHANQS
jgi:hypothetical protein